MDSGNDNVLKLLLALSADPQRASAALNLFSSATSSLERDTRATSEHTTELLKANKAHQEAIAALSRMQLESRAAVEPIRQMQEAFRGLAPEIAQVAGQTEQHTNAAQRAALALRSETAVGAELLSTGLAGLIAGRKAQAGIEAVWETARGIALLAEGTWPPNPAAIMAAGLHFEAAAQYALLAGTSSHRHRSAGGGGGGAYDHGGSYGGGISPYGPPAQTLAPGAAGASPRFGSGVVIIRGTQEFENYVASAVNGAVARGVSVTATTSQRGAPVGH
jgi:hypothetical protein